MSRRERSERRQTLMNRVYRIGTAKTYSGRHYSVYVKAQYKNGKLSISGVEGPTRGGNCMGACGQIDMHDWNIVNYSEGWNRAKERRLREIWKQWHLNDMHAECEHQRERGETWSTHPSAVCPVCGWKLGHGWKTVAVPDTIVAELMALPEADRQPAWI